MLLQLKATAPATPFLWVCKGLEAGSGLLPHQVVAEVMGDVACGVLTGPSFALEVARGLPTAITLAAADAALPRKPRKACTAASCASTPTKTWSAPKSAAR